MTGIYIHIPFCKKVCYYCDFHFTVSFIQKDAVLDAILKEIELRQDYLPSRHIDTIYFGGGTPSVLSKNEIRRVLDKINKLFNISSDAEITLEANPDDLSGPYLRDLNQIGFNRLSIGIQSFFDEDLNWMNRRHSGNEAEQAVKLSQDEGFTNMNIDLIYGLPQLSGERWKQNMEKFLTLGIPHLSAYHLTIEPKTVFGYYKRKGKLTEIDEEKSIEQYNDLINFMKSNGFEHYEISNFCKDGLYSKHNTNYWKQGHYLGIGPSAHSFNGTSRQWNVRVNSQYIEAIAKGLPFYEKEQLSDEERFNDFLLTGLRTIWGVNLEVIRNQFGDFFLAHLEKELHKISDTKYIYQNGNYIRLTEAGMFVSDSIISKLFCVLNKKGTKVS
ncbi:MAG TPA: radical SAM family heme chaperone HemW [Bacteroidales bacterium]